MLSSPFANKKPQLAWESASAITAALEEFEQQTDVIMSEVEHLEETLENWRSRYNAALEERNEMHNLLESAEGRLGEVQKVVQRYINVQEPVVASDGYTYERSVIQQYLEDCQQSNNKAYSQQTNEVLSETLLPNQSLKKLVELLKTVKPQEVEELRAHEPLAPVREGGRSVDVSVLSKVPVVARAPVHAGDLEASLWPVKDTDQGGQPGSLPTVGSKDDAGPRELRGNSHAAGQRGREVEAKRQAPTSFAAAVAGGGKSVAAPGGAKVAPAAARPATVTATAPAPKAASSKKK